MQVRLIEYVCKFDDELNKKKYEQKKLKSFGINLNE
jgi:hypothetical protein